MSVAPRSSMKSFVKTLIAPGVSRKGVLSRLPSRVFAARYPVSSSAVTWNGLRVTTSPAGGVAGGGTVVCAIADARNTSEAKGMRMTWEEFMRVCEKKVPVVRPRQGGRRCDKNILTMMEVTRFKGRGG